MSLNLWRSGQYRLSRIFKKVCNSLSTNHRYHDKQSQKLLHSHVLTGLRIFATIVIQNAPLIMATVYRNPPVIEGNCCRTKNDLQSIYLRSIWLNFGLLWPPVQVSSFSAFAFRSEALAICSSKVLVM